MQCPIVLEGKIPMPTLGRGQRHVGVPAVKAPCLDAM
jgi:hypothetical protein